MAAAAWASDGNSWNPFASDVSSYSQPYDRAFIREWEANPPRGYPTISPANIDPMKAAIKRYAEVVKDGGWKPVPDGELQVGVTSNAVAVLRDRLLSSGDLKEGSSYPNYFDYYLERAVKRFQASNGLTPTGIVDNRTIAALNVPASARLRQLRTNLGRVSELARSAGKKYVLVNIPATQIEAVDNDRVVSRHSGVVGKIDRQTPLLRSSIHELNFNPVWTLPPTVIEKDLIPKGREMSRRNQDVLVKYGIDAYGGDGRKLDSSKINWSSGSVHNLSYRQQPGKDNPLGFLKINFHNNHSVYMHDTPSESLFGRNFRAASSGCVRVQNIEALGAWLLAGNGWSRDHIEAMKKSGERQDVRLKKPVSVYFAYITAWATEDGVVQFRRDLYQKDGAGTTVSAY
ncbi:MAG: L,D-transpeptidase family protein [Hyphomicrobiaceae bacterium]|nr:L,D-transpeptidase family protein [Hyphomicrobiaceae bacterium]